jgi:hypothetical protein
MITIGRMTVAVLLLALASCDTAPSEVVNAGDYGSTYRITCGGFFSGPRDCYDKAGSICLRGYTVVKETDIKPPESSYIFFWQTGAHEITVKCSMS